MRLPLLFRRENSAAARREREEQIERAVSAGLRTLASMFQKAADLIESRRLNRNGFKPPGEFLERTARSGKPPPPGSRQE